jgi:hypothetical protein
MKTGAMSELALKDFDILSVQASFSGKEPKKFMGLF